MRRDGIRPASPSETAVSGFSFDGSLPNPTGSSLVKIFRRDSNFLEKTKQQAKILHSLIMIGLVFTVNQYGMPLRSKSQSHTPTPVLRPPLKSFASFGIGAFKSRTRLRAIAACPLNHTGSARWGKMSLVHIG